MTTVAKLPNLSADLLALIGSYGLARTDGVSEVERVHRWQQLIDGIKQYAADCVAALSPAELGDPVTADNAKAADSAALAMIGMGYAWDGVHWYQATPRAAEADWLPIESIPGDAKRVLVHTRLGECHVEYVTVLSGAIAAARMEDEPCFFTHWQPLPAPPALTPPSAKGE